MCDLLCVPVFLCFYVWDTVSDIGYDIGFVLVTISVTRKYTIIFLAVNRGRLVSFYSRISCNLVVQSMLQRNIRACIALHKRTLRA